MYCSMYQGKGPGRPTLGLSKLAVNNVELFLLKNT